MLNIIVAPDSVAENAERYTKRIVSYLKSQKVEYAVYFSTSLDSVKDSANELSSLGETDFVIVGGDIVIHTFLNNVKNLSKIKFGIVPVSSGDDFAKFLGISLNPVQAIKDILSGNVEGVDYLTANNIRVLNNIMLGASCELYDKYSQHKVKNAFTKSLVVAKYANKFEGVNIVMDYKGERGKTELVYDMCIANGGLLDGNHVSPLSNVQDGLFNFNYAVVQDGKKKNYLSLLKKGKHIYEDKSQQFWLNSLKLTNEERKIKALIDGVVYNLEELNIAVVENGLKIYKHK